MIYRIPKLNDIYNLIEKSRSKYGRFKKCEMHLHTPSSHDYEFIKGKKYRNLTLGDIYDVAVDIGYLTEDAILLIKDREKEYLEENYLENLKDTTPYENFKEYIAFQIIAHKLYKENIEVVVVCDHNTVSGYKKLKFAVEEYYEKRIKSSALSSKFCISVLLGVEISCSDRHHLIVILNESRLNEFKSYLDDILLSEEEGTYLDSRYLIEYLSDKFNAITYLAHLNSSDYLGSGAYNTKLFGLKELKLLGTKIADDTEIIKQKISTFVGDMIERFQFILEGDSHCLEDIGVRNTWIKFDIANFRSFKKAVENRGICIRIRQPNGVNRFIKGVVVVPGDLGFLVNKNGRECGKPFFISFSKDLNCIIGGRGSGKSTLLNILETSFILETNNLKTLEFICNHKVIFCIFHLDGTDFILRFIPIKKDKKDYYYIKDENLFHGIQKMENGIKISKTWIDLFKIEDGKFNKVNESEYGLILNKIFRRSYNINRLVNKINNGSISDFIREVVTYGISYNNIESFIERLRETPAKSFAKVIKELLPNIIQYLDNRKQEVLVHINKFNSENDKVIEIIYSPKEKDAQYYLIELLSLFNSKENIEGTYLTWQQVQVFIIDAVKIIGYLRFLELLLNNNYKKIESYIQIEKYIDESELTFSKVELELVGIHKTNIAKVYMAIRNRFKSDRKLLEESIIRCFKITDDFTINFNINSKESVRTESCMMKNIEELSLGQKVVALLTFVFNFGASCNDNTPLIIDQPEDNLDNQYIYRNLVDSLKRIKSTRQVIIVTHSSTIVTNADSEQVIVMSSDNKNGWIEKTGYPSEKGIIKHIINYLEGGQDSFKHKKEIYELFIPELS